MKRFVTVVLTPLSLCQPAWSLRLSVIPPHSTSLLGDNVQVDTLVADIPYDRGIAIFQIWVDHANILNVATVSCSDYFSNINTRYEDSLHIFGHTVSLT